MTLRRLTGGLGLGAMLSFAAVHAVHVLAVTAGPVAVGAAVRFVCHIP